MNPSATPVPFAFTFTPQGRLVSGEAAMSSLTTYRLNGDGTLSDPTLAERRPDRPLLDRAALGGFYFVSNTGSNNVSSFRVGADGQPALIWPSAAAARITVRSTPRCRAATTSTCRPAPTGTVDEFRIGTTARLRRSAPSPGLPVGQEGIASS